MAVRRARPEQQLQKAVLDHLRWRAAPGTFAFHPANGGARSPIEARILKSQGVVASVPDVIILHDGKTYGLELKATGGALSPAQRECHALVTSNGPVFFAPPPVGVDVSGWLAGGQIGANYQAGSWVVGAEADVSGANLTGSTTCISTPIVAGVVIAGLPLPANCSVKVVGLGTIAGRLGFALDRTLVYGKGGAAWANYKYDLTPDNEVADLLPTFSGNETKWGWMLGAGVEYAFFDNWSAKIEYNYLAFSTSNHQFTGTGAGQFVLNTGIQQQLHLVKAGINYRWGWAPVGIRY